MSKLPFEAFLALRYLRPRRTFVSVITMISIVGVMLGVAVFIVVIAVMSGFDKEWRDRILGFNAHLKVYKLDTNSWQEAALDNYEAVMATVASNKNILAVAPFVRGQVLLETQPKDGNPKILAPLMIGVDPKLESRVSVLTTNIVDGKFDVGNEN